MEELIQELKDNPKRFFRKREAAKFFNRSTSTIQRWIDEGRLVSFQPAGMHLIPKSSIIQLLESKRTE